MSGIYVDIDVDEFVDGCSSREIKELVDYLRKEGHLDEYDDAPDEQMSVLDSEWAQVIDKISGRARLRLTNEEEEIIKKIASRF
jgi:hypothetical protein